MTIEEIYSSYGIVKKLQQHQLCVACVADIICENSSVPVPTHDIIVACLLHDMGNMVRFQGGRFLHTGNTDLSFYEPEGVEYRKDKAISFQNRYCTDELHVTHMILEELNTSKQVHEIVDHIDVYKAGKRGIEDVAGIIAYYADLRVSPYGVVSIEERISDAAQRNATRLQHMTIQENITSSKHEEELLFSLCTLNPNDITQEYVDSALEKMREYDIHKRI